MTCAKHKAGRDCGVHGPVPRTHATYGWPTDALTEVARLNREVERLRETLLNAHDFVSRVRVWDGTTDDEQSELLAELEA